MSGRRLGRLLGSLLLVAALVSGIGGVYLFGNAGGSSQAGDIVWQRVQAGDIVWQTAQDGDIVWQTPGTDDIVWQ
ncbi:hypothetical protein ACQPWR_29595 [Micromonospora vinacea]|uniref:hypothetical protein n=1 Tax=Micromonospora vinacea TaxID=709878 RepID=UPI003D8E5373